jgi:hypothetical protein
MLREIKELGQMKTKLLLQRTGSYKGQNRPHLRCRKFFLPSQIYALFIEFYYALFFKDMHYITMIRTFCIMKKMTFTAAVLSVRFNNKTQVCVYLDHVLILPESGATCLLAFCYSSELVL